jgi:hypothetical protein
MQESKDRTKSMGAISAGSPSGSPYDGISNKIFIRKSFNYFFEF